MKKILVIGSGPAAWASILMLKDLGLSPEVWDIGAEQDSSAKALKDALKGKTTLDLSAAEAAALYQNPETVGRKFPIKELYGSTWFHGFHQRNVPVHAPQSTIAPTFAKGGMAVGWGGAVLPIHADDMNGWPIRRSELEPGFAFIEKHLPITIGSSSQDADRRAFPISDDTNGMTPLSDRMQKIGESLNKGLKEDFCQPSRLAFNMQKCNGCGLCLTGCPQGAIFSFADSIDALHQSGAIVYKRDRTVQTVKQLDDGMLVSWHDQHMNAFEDHFDRVFLAAGAIGSTRIVMQSRSCFDVPVSMKESQKFALPALSLAKARTDAPVFELPSLFIDRKIDGHWVHIQVNEGGRFAREKLPKFVPGFAKKRLMDHMLVGFGGLHSDYSGHVDLTLLRAHRDGIPVLGIEPVEPGKTAKKVLRNTIRMMAADMIKAGLVTAPWLAMIAPPSGNLHYGSSMPMRAKPKDGFDTDILGRPAGMNDLHVVDSSVLTSLPATTMAFTIMANAARIASEAVKL